MLERRAGTWLARGRGERGSLCRSQAAYRRRRSSDGEVLMAARRAAGVK